MENNTELLELLQFTNTDLIERAEPEIQSLIGTLLRTVEEQRRTISLLGQEMDEKDTSTKEMRDEYSKLKFFIERSYFPHMVPRKGCKLYTGESKTF